MKHTVVFNYNDIRVVIAEGGDKTAIFCGTTAPRVVGTNLYQYIDDSLVLFEKSFKKAHDIAPYVELYVRAAQALGEFVKGDWRLVNLHQPGQSTKYVPGFLHVCGETKKVWNAVGLSERKLKKFIKSFPQAPDKVIKELQQHDNAIENLQQLGVEARNKLALEQATKSLSVLNVDQILQLAEELSNKPGNYNLAKTFQSVEK